ncbi:protein phosphatase 1 regulatory subunit 12B [Cloeon dipterum]|uniref:protein phosphatase 1 regulatory subunit 12B n=1 Tax=Cloeon dipterum TaxID=197152 RepID=UPI0032202868
MPLVENGSSERTGSFRTAEHRHQGKRHVTSLMYACQQNRDGQVRELLAQNKSQLIKQRDRTMKSALHYCVENSSATSAELVLAAAPELLDARDKDGFTPLNLAIIAGNISLVRFLLHKRADLNAVDNEKHSLVHWATVCGEVEALEALLEAGADPCMPDIHNGYPIHYAAQMCGANSEMGNDTKVGIKMLSKLLARKVSVHVVDSDGRQPILWAASAGSADAVLSLINAGAAVEAADKDGLTALHCAASRGHTECLETLITLCGANVNVIDNHGCTALFYAVTLGHADCTQLLLNFGADYDTQDRRGRTSAHCGAAKGQLETLKLLHTAGADLWKRNVRGELPLHDAVQSGRRELVRWLLALRPDMVTAANSDGCSCLHIAAIRNYVEMCRVLLDGESFVNPVMRTSKGALMTPLDAALAKENRSCAKYLQLLGGVPASKLTEEAAALRGQRKAYLDHMDLVTPRLEASPSLLSGYSTPAMQQFNSLEVPQVSSKVSHDDDQISSQRSARKVRLRKSKSPRSSSSESDNDADREKRVRRKSRRHVSKEKKERRVQSVDGAADAAVDAREENREEADTEHATRAKATRDRSSASKSKKQLIDMNQITTDDDEVASEASVLETREAERKEERKIAESNTDANDAKKEEQEKTKAASAKAKSARHRSQPQAKLEKSKSDKAESQKVDEAAGKPSTVQQKGESRGQLTPVGEASTSSEQSLTDGSEREKTAATAVVDVKSAAQSPPKLRETGKSKSSSIPSGSGNNRRSESKSRSASVDTDKSQRRKPDASPRKKEAERVEKPNKENSEKSDGKADESKNVEESISSSREENEVEKAKKSESKTPITSEKPRKIVEQGTKNGEIIAKKSESKTSATSEKTRKIEEQGTKNGAIIAKKSESKTSATSEKNRKIEEQGTKNGEIVAKKSESKTSATSEKNRKIEEQNSKESEESSDAKIPDTLNENEKVEEEEPKGKLISNKNVEIKNQDAPKTEIKNIEEEKVMNEKSTSKKPEIEHLDVSQENIPVEEKKNTNDQSTTEIATNKNKKVSKERENSREKEESSTIKSETKKPDVTPEIKNDKIDETALEDVAPKRNQKKTEIIAGTNAKKQENGAKSKKAVSSEHEKASASKIIETPKQDSDTSDSVGKTEGVPDAKSKKSEIEAPFKTDDPKQKPSKKQETAKNSRAMSKERKESEVSKPRQTAIKEASRVAPSKPPRAALSEKGDRDGKSQEKAEGSDACSETNASSSDVSQTQAEDGTSDSKSAPDKRADSNNRKQRKLKREANASETPGTTEGTAAASSDSHSDPTETEFQDTDSGVQEKTGKSSEQESEHWSESTAHTTADDKFVEEHSSSSSRAAKEEIATGKGDKITEAPGARHKKPDDAIAIPSVTVVESGQQAKREGPRNKAAEKDEPAVIAVAAVEPKKTVAFEKQALEPAAEPTKHLINGKPSQRVPPLPKGLHQQPIDRSAQIEEDEKKAREIIRRRHEQSVVSVTQAVQVSTRKYQLERRIFQELLELKKMQLRTGRGNESVIVKRAVDEYRKAGLIVGLRQYDGPYSFRAFEQYLYDQLKLLQNSSDARIIARLKPTDDVSSLAAALRLSVPRHSPAFCTVSTHRCHHATDAYTNVPVANYVARLPQTERFLPEIESPKKENGSLVSTATTKTLRHVDIRKPMTLELSLGGERQIIALPTEKLDKSKRYFVSFSIKPKHTSVEAGREAPEDNKHQHATTI